MVFIITRRGLINAQCIVRLNKTDDPDTIIVEHNTAVPLTDGSDHRHVTTFCHIREVAKIGLTPEDFDNLGSREF